MSAIDRHTLQKVHGFYILRAPNRFRRMLSAGMPKSEWLQARQEIVRQQELSYPELDGALGLDWCFDICDEVIMWRAHDTEEDWDGIKDDIAICHKALRAIWMMQFMFGYKAIDRFPKHETDWVSPLWFSRFGADVPFAEWAEAQTKLFLRRLCFLETLCTTNGKSIEGMRPTMRLVYDMDPVDSRVKKP